MTGAIDVISSKTIEQVPVSNIAYSLQGTVPGLIITDNGGKPGSTPSLNIRAIGTMSSTEPLVIIDGVPAGLGDFYALRLYMKYLPSDFYPYYPSLLLPIKHHWMPSIHK